MASLGFSGRKAVGMQGAAEPVGPELQSGCTHIVFLALQFLPKLELVHLQLVEGLPELLGLVPGKVPKVRLGWVSPGAQATRCPPPAITEGKPRGSREPPRLAGSGCASRCPRVVTAGPTSACPR